MTAVLVNVILSGSWLSILGCGSSASSKGTYQIHPTTNMLCLLDDSYELYFDNEKKNPTWMLLEDFFISPPPKKVLTMLVPALNTGIEFRIIP